MKTILALIILAGLLAWPCGAAEIDFLPEENGQPAVAFVHGDLALADADTFKEKLSATSRALIAFDSDGGSVFAGVAIGRFIRLKGFITAVFDGSRCASACAIAWLGGTTRLMGKRSLVGFHAAYKKEGGQALESGVANAVVGAYLNQIGLPLSAVVYVTKAAPDVMTWLTFKEAADHGIDVREAPPLASQTAAAPAASPHVTGSVDRSAEVAVATPPPPAPYSVDQPVDVATATPLVPTIRPPEHNDLERRTRDFIVMLLAKADSLTLNVASELGQVYTDYVSYYGKNVTRDFVLTDKQQFAHRWPQRRYALRDQLTTVVCKTPTLCTLTGLMEWAAWSVQRGTGVRGTSQVEYSVQWLSGGPKVVSEQGSVIQRQTAKPTMARARRGWWVVLGSFQTGFFGIVSPEVETSVRRTIGDAFLCGYDAFNDSSSNFSGLASGVMVVVVGPFASRDHASAAQKKLGECVPGAYPKYAHYSGQ